MGGTKLLHAKQIPEKRNFIFLYFWCTCHVLLYQRLPIKYNSNSIIFYDISTVKAVPYLDLSSNVKT